jgi:nucleoid-associated protein YgaU
MKRIFLLLALATCFLPVRSRADAAADERFNQLSGKIEDLIAGQEAQRKRLAELAKEVENLREQQSKPAANDYASQGDLKRLAEAVKEVDHKRMDDYGKIHDEILKLGKKLSMPAPTPSRKADKATPSSDDTATPAAADKKVFEYTIQPGDTLSVIVQAYKEQNIKVTVDQILKANPGLKPDRLSPGKKIVIPAPK